MRSFLLFALQMFYGFMIPGDQEMHRLSIFKKNLLGFEVIMGFSYNKAFFYFVFSGRGSQSQSPCYSHRNG